MVPKLQGCDGLGINLVGSLAVVVVWAIDWSTKAAEASLPVARTVVIQTRDALHDIRRERVPGVDVRRIGEASGIALLLPESAQVPGRRGSQRERPS